MVGAARREGRVKGHMLIVRRKGQRSKIKWRPLAESYTLERNAAVPSVECQGQRSRVKVKGQATPLAGRS